MKTSETPSMLLAWVKDNVRFDQRFQGSNVHDQTLRCFICNETWRILKLLASY